MRLAPMMTGQRAVSSGSVYFVHFQENVDCSNVFLILVDAREMIPNYMGLISSDNMASFTAFA
jgi:hypothetical protein